MNVYTKQPCKHKRKIVSSILEQRVKKKKKDSWLLNPIPLLRHITPICRGGFLTIKPIVMNELRLSASTPPLPSLRGCPCCGRYQRTYKKRKKKIQNVISERELNVECGMIQLAENLRTTLASGRVSCSQRRVHKMFRSTSEFMLNALKCTNV